MRYQLRYIRIARISACLKTIADRSRLIQTGTGVLSACYDHQKKFDATVPEWYSKPGRIVMIAITSRQK
jgi:hypothetical protein